MNFKTTFILLTLLIVAVTVFILSRIGGDDNPDKTPTDKSALTEGRRIFDTPVSSSGFTRVNITGGDAGKLVFEKSAGKWRITAPINVRADAGTVDRLIDDLLALRSNGQVEASSAPTGLDKPAFQVELAGAKTIKIDVGRKSPTGDTMFLRVDGATKAEIARLGFGKVYEDLGRSIDEWRDKRVVSVPSDEIKQIDFTRGESHIALRKMGPDWKVTEPTAMPAESSDVESLARAIASLEASEFVKADSPAVKLAGLERPKLTITFNTAAPATQPTTVPSTGPASAPAAGGFVLSIGTYENSLKEKVYARLSDSPQVFKVAASILKDFEKTPSDLRDRAALSINDIEVSDISLTIDKPATTQPTTMPAEKREIRISRRKADLSIGPVFTPATGPTTAPASAPSTKPAGSGALDIPSPGAAVFGLLQASPSHPASAPSSRPATMPHSSQPTTLPSTGPSTQPTVASTQPTTGPTTQVVAPPFIPPIPVKPKSAWVLGPAGNVDADDAQVTDLLSALHPLRAAKYLDKLPAPPTTQPTTNPVTTQPTTNPASAAIVYTIRIKTIGAGGASTGSYELRITDPGGTSKPVVQYQDLIFEVERDFLRKLEGDFKTPKSPDFTPSMPPGGGFPGGGFPPGGFHPPGEP